MKRHCSKLPFVTGVLVILLGYLELGSGKKAASFERNLAVSQVELQDGKGVTLCWGTAITDNMIVTSAQCVFRETATSGIKVVAGHGMKNKGKKSGGRQEELVYQLLTHEEFDPRTLANDIGLVFLTNPLETSEDYHSIPILRRPETITEKGYVIKSPRIKKFEEGQVLEVNITGTKYCEGMRYNESERLCGTVETDSSEYWSAPGDPLFCKHACDGTVAILCGIASSGGCPNTAAGLSQVRTVYSNLGHHYTWMQDKQQRVTGKLSYSTYYITSGIEFIIAEKYPEALKIINEFLKKDEKILGSRHLDVLQAKHLKGVLLFKFGKFKESFRLTEEVLQLRMDILGPSHPETIASAAELAMGYLHGERYVEALDLYRVVLKQQMQMFGRLYRDTISTRHNIGNILIALGKNAQALKWLKDLVEDEEVTLGPGNGMTLITKANIARMLFNDGEQVSALKIYKAVVKDAEKALGQGHEMTLDFQRQLGMANMAQGNFKEAMEIFNHVLAEFTRLYGAESEKTLGIRTTVENVKNILSFL